MQRTDVLVDDDSWAEPGLRELLRRDPAAAARSLGLAPPADAPNRALVEVVKVLSMVWQDGRIVPKRDFSLSPDDEGLLFGRGVWESTRTFHGRPWLWKLHMNRLRNTAKMLNIAVQESQLPDESAVSRFVRSLTGMEVIIRLNVSAGAYKRPGTVWMTAAPLTARMKSIRLQTCLNSVPKDQPYLNWKTFQYATRLRMGQQAGPGFDSTLMIDPQGRLLEAAHANLFVRRDAGWATPTAAEGGLLPGTVRHHLLHNAPFPIAEREIFKAELGEIREAFVTNSNVGIVPVTRIDEYELPIGQDTLRLGEWLEPESPYHVETATVSMA